MSNKSRLQTNNSNLQSLISKANALPNAGGGGGGSVETCTVTIEKTDRLATPEVCYTDASGEFCSYFFTPMPATQTVEFEVIKNTIVLVYGNTVNVAVSGSATRLSSSDDYVVTGDATLTLST